jgi:hypothetical protein
MLYTTQRRRIDAAIDILLEATCDVQDAYDECMYSGRYVGLGAMGSDIRRLDSQVTMLMSIIQRTKKVFV